MGIPSWLCLKHITFFPRRDDLNRYRCACDTRVSYDFAYPLPRISSVTFWFICTNILLLGVLIKV